MDINQIYVIASGVVAAYEVVARIIPTQGNWSIVHKLVLLLDLFIKNKAVVTPVEGPKTVAEFTVAAVVKKEEIVDQTVTPLV